MFTRLMLMSKWVLKMIPISTLPHHAHELQLPLTHSSSSLTFIHNTIRTFSFPHILLTTHVNLTLGSLSYTEALTKYTKNDILICTSQYHTFLFNKIKIKFIDQAKASEIKVLFCYWQSMCLETNVKRFKGSIAIIKNWRYQRGNRKPRS